MPDVNQYTVSNRELLELLIKQCNVHEGKWVLMVNFGFSVGNFGQTLDQVAPGTIVTLNYTGIQKATPDTPESMQVDAALINPERKSGRAA